LPRFGTIHKDEHRFAGVRPHRFYPVTAVMIVLLALRNDGVKLLAYKIFDVRQPGLLARWRRETDPGG
jgi:hypothetical protein